MQRFFTADAVTSLDDIRKCLADPKHWRVGYSACELANSWVSAGDFPPAVRQVMQANLLFADARLIEAFFERKVDLGTPGHPSQNDILVYAEARGGHVAIAVEGKVKESFDRYVRDKEMTPGLHARLEDLCKRLEVDPAAVQQIRYQLLHRSVSALLEAERYGAEHALMLVHSFCPHDTSFEDYRAFAGVLGFAPETVRVNRIIGSKRLGNVRLHLGWVRDTSTVNIQASSQDSGFHAVPPDPEVRQGTAEQTRCTHPTQTIQQIRQAIRPTGAQPKLSRSVSSNISSGFKRATGGQDYKDYFDQNLRSRIADLGANLGVPTDLLVDLVVAIRGCPASQKSQMLNEIMSK